MMETGMFLGCRDLHRSPDVEWQVISTVSSVDLIPRSEYTEVSFADKQVQQNLRLWHNKVRLSCITMIMDGDESMKTPDNRSICIEGSLQGEKGNIRPII